MWIQMQTITKRNILYRVQQFLHALLHIVISIMATKVKEFLTLSVKVLVYPGHLEVQQVEFGQLVLFCLTLYCPCANNIQRQCLIPGPQLFSGNIPLQTLRQQCRHLKLLPICQGRGRTKLIPICQTSSKVKNTHR